MLTILAVIGDGPVDGGAAVIDRKGVVLAYDEGGAVAEVAFLVKAEVQVEVSVLAVVGDWIVDRAAAHVDGKGACLVEIPD